MQVDTNEPFDYSSAYRAKSTTSLRSYSSLSVVSDGARSLKMLTSTGFPELPTNVRFDRKRSGWGQV